VSRWAEADALAFNIVRAKERANSVTTVLVQGREPSVLSDYCREKCGVVLGRGIGDLQGRAFRIAHMGHVNAPMVFGVLGAIEMALGARWASRTDAAASRPPWNILDARCAPSD
jgi:alanine-glyoxylate transaminase / serine-glyoxylate transaminase / serine-pyruvate transaminase